MTLSQACEGGPWFSVRCIFRARAGSRLIEDLPVGVSLFEERITIWQAATFEDAIGMAEDEARRYAGDIEWDYLGLAQAYRLVDPPGHGAEVYSLMRESRLTPSKYLDRFFDTGTEHQHADT